MPEPEQEAYDQSRNEYWTYLATIETTGKKRWMAGLAEGEAKAKAEKPATARKLRHLGVPAEVITQTTGLSLDEITQL
ncbi:MAG: hypothetical protein LBT46_01435 [Planctomycetaceae bacterium]|jgi:hypothetical protein|nr:hypothetical protein [Planctomycetaceae bacterium]